MPSVREPLNNLFQKLEKELKNLKIISEQNSYKIETKLRVHKRFEGSFILFLRTKLLYNHS